MSTALILTGATELAKLAIQFWFLYQQTVGKSEAEIDALYQEQKGYFLSHPPSTLPNVPDYVIE